jgi:hypothetical protein
LLVVEQVAVDFTLQLGSMMAGVRPAELFELPNRHDVRISRVKRNKLEILAEVMAFGPLFSCSSRRLRANLVVPLYCIIGGPTVEFYLVSEMGFFLGGWHSIF